MLEGHASTASFLSESHLRKCNETQEVDENVRDYRARREKDRNP